MTHARITAWAQPLQASAIVLPGGPLYLLGHETPAAEVRYHRSVGPPEDQDVRVEVRLVSGRQMRLSCSSPSRLHWSPMLAIPRRRADPRASFFL